MKEKIYPESGVELSPFISRHYDRILSMASMGHYPQSIKRAVKDMGIQPEDHILDFSEFDMDSMPFHHRAIFKAVECKYAFDFIERDWKSILRKHGFQDFTEHFYLGKYMRLLEAVK